MACAFWSIPAIGHQPITELKTRHFAALLKGIEEKGLLAVASRTQQHLCNIMRYAVQQGWVENNPALNLVGVTAPPVRRHYPALPLERLPELLERIEGYRQGRELTRLAVLLTPVAVNEVVTLCSSASVSLFYCPGADVLRWDAGLRPVCAISSRFSG